MNHLSLRLTYRIAETEFRPDVADAVRQVYGIELGNGYVYNVLTSFRVNKGWTSPFWMIYDTGAVISLLPLAFFRILRVEKYAPVKLMGT